ncbi:hypothetical protein [Verrucomicrobium spinosum]|uniref:putative polyvalent protein kinase domain-containing protein n=2 Tax=Verrucomicrobium spinosum TaxID=2736 RepID=UPI0012F63619|nr:hypothetical protein [Verrucomicrobium spinosum]
MARLFGLQLPKRGTPPKSFSKILGPDDIVNPQSGSGTLNAAPSGSSASQETLRLLLERARTLGLAHQLSGISSRASALIRLASQKPQYHIAPALRAALRALIGFKEKGGKGTVEEYLQQQDRLTPGTAPEMAQLAAALGKATSPESVRAILDEYLRLAHAVTTTTGEPLPTNADLIRRAIDQSSIPSGSSATQRLNTSPIRQEDLRFAAQASAELAKHDEVFRHPVSKSGLLEDVMADVVDFATYLGEDTRPDERQESEADRRFVFRTDNGKLFYVYERGQRGRGEVWIDVSRLEEGDGGSAIYAAVGNYAKNSRRKFIGDPKGLSESAIVRRTSAMLSLALRHGRTDFMEPAAEQLKGVPEKGIAPLKWEGDDVAKIASLIETFLSHLHQKIPALRNYRYDFERQQFIYRDGRPVGRERFDAGAETNLVRASRAGQATLRRAIFLQSLASSQGSERPQLLEALLHGNREHAGSGDPSVSLNEGGPLHQLFAAPLQPPSGGPSLHERALRAILAPVPQKIRLIFAEFLKDRPIAGIAQESGLPEVAVQNIVNQMRARYLTALKLLQADALALQAAGPMTSASTRPRLSFSRGQGNNRHNRTLASRRSSASPSVYREALAAIRRRLPGLVHQRVLVFDSPADLAASSYGEDYSDAEIASMEEAEALFDRHTGRTLIFASQIELRVGETPLHALARLLLHDRVGHEGVNFLLATDEAIGCSWNQLASRIPRGELQAILNEPGYQHLAGHPADLALEWLARKVEQVEGARTVAELENKLPSLARRMWQALQEAVAKLMDMLSRNGKAAFERDVRDLISLARQAALDGRSAAHPTDDLLRRSSEREPRSQPPDFIRLALPHNPDTLDPNGNQTGRSHQDRNPGRALESLRRSALGAKARRHEKAGRVQDGPERRSGRESPGLSRVHGETLTRGIAPLQKLGGAEHDVYPHQPSNLAVKLTKPGEFGWDGNLQTYLRRLAWGNLLFDDDVAVEGLTQLPGESLPRLVTTQPWYRADKVRPHPDASEVEAYMRARGFLKVADGAYVHKHLDISASDAKAASLIRTEAGVIHPIDIILDHTPEQDYRRMRDLAERTPQMPAPRQARNGTGPDSRLQFSSVKHNGGRSAGRNLIPKKPNETPSKIDGVRDIPYINRHGDPPTRRDAEAALGELIARAETDSGRNARADAAERLRAEAESLVSWSRQKGWLIHPEGFERLVEDLPIFEGGVERNVFGHPPSGRVIKVTLPPNFGARGELSAYLKNIAWSNLLYGDDIRLEGVIETKAGPAVVVSQPFIEGRQPSLRRIRRWFEAQGYVPDGYNKWRHPKTGAVIADTHQGNFVVVGRKYVVPIDLQVLNPGEKGLE